MHIKKSNFTEVRIEACSVCQLRCPLCTTGRGLNVKTLGNGYLQPENFAKFLELNPTIESVELANYGEVFLNPKLHEIFRIGHEKGVRLTLQGGANLNTATDEALEALVKYRVDRINVSLDGASQETYSKYRIRGDFDTVIENVKTINRFKKKYNSEFPTLRWQFIPFAHNEHEFDKAKAMAEELDMKFRPKKSWDKKWSVAKGDYNFKQKDRWEGIDEKVSRDKLNGAGTKICDQLWNKVAVNWNGDVLGCCVNSRKPFQGNAFEEDLETLTKKYNYLYAKAMVHGKMPDNDDIACTNCGTYKTMKKRNAFIVPDEQKINIREIT